MSAARAAVATMRHNLDINTAAALYDVTAASIEWYRVVDTESRHTQAYRLLCACYYPVQCRFTVTAVCRYFGARNVGLVMRKLEENSVHIDL